VADEALEHISALARLRSYYQHLVVAPTPSRVVQAAVEAVRQALQADISWLGVKQGDQLVMAAYSGFHDPCIAEIWRLGLSQGVGGKVAVEGRPMTVRDYLHDPRRVPVMKHVMDGEGIRGAVCVPVAASPAPHDEESIVGVLYAAHRRPHSYSQDEIDLLAAIGRDTGSALAAIAERAALEARLDEAGNDLSVLARRLQHAKALADAFAETGDLGAGLRYIAASFGVELRFVDQFGKVLRKAGDLTGAVQRRLTIRAGVHDLGTLEVVRAEPLSADEDQTLTAMAPIVALQLLRERSALEAELRLHNQFLDDLLRGEIADIDGLTQRASVLGIDLAAPAAVVCIGLHVGRRLAPQEAPPPLTRHVADMIDRLARAYFEQVIVAPRGPDITMLVGTADRDRADLQRLLQNLLGEASDLLRGKPLTAGFGRFCLGPSDYAESFGEASTALEMARTRTTPGHVLSPADLGLYGILSRGMQSGSLLRNLVEGALGPLVAADREGATEYIKTLDAYLANDRHFERAAADLHVHVNTLRKRLTKIQEISGLDLHDVDARFLLELALRVQAALES
jgi:sugar diacid utilization regulator